MRFQDITTNGTYELNDGKPFANSPATITKEGTGTVVVGYKNKSGAFRAFADGAMAKDDLLTYHGGSVLMVVVTAISGTLVIGLGG